MSTTAYPKLSPEDKVDTVNAAPREHTSIWLYIAGWLVSMSGLFAVNYSLSNPGFAVLTYSLVTCGYVISYILRVRDLSLRAVQTPMLVGISLIVLAAISSGQGIEWLMPVEDAEDKGKSLQLLFAWFAVLHSFTLSADANILFVCVPCMTMIALASTQGTESELLNSFLVFVGAATFMMVHENYLRTRQGRVLGRTRDTERRLFGGQIQLAAFCVISALLLANFVAVPIRQVGMSLSLAGGLASLNNAAAKQGLQQSARASVSETNELELARGPETQSTSVVMKVKATRGLYMRGSTFDFYTGRSFRNQLDQSQFLTPQTGGTDSVARYQDYVDIREAGGGQGREFNIPTGLSEIAAEEMQGSDQVVQTIQPNGGRMVNIYGAANPIKVRGMFRGMQISNAGAMKSADGPTFSMDQYTVVSQVPTEDGAILRASADKPIPEAIQRLYLQVANTASGTENARLRTIATEVTQGIRNPYDKALALERYLEQTCKYNLQAERAPRDRDIVEYFLTVSKEGYCDSFAAALTMLCRYAGIPARMASGFLPGEFQERENVYAIRQKDKHVWTEVFFPGAGWVGFDATDGAEDVSQRDSNDKARKGGFIGWVMSQGWLTVLVGGLCFVLLVTVLKTEVWDRWFAGRSRTTTAAVIKPRTNLEIIAAYTQATALLAKRGLERPAHLTPYEFAVEVKSRNDATLPGLCAPLEELTTLFTRYRYSAETATEAEVAQAHAAGEAMKQQLHEAKRENITQLAAPVPA